MDTLYTVWSKREFNQHIFDKECKKWINLLLQLVDVTGRQPHIHLQRFLHGKTDVLMKYRQYIIDHVSLGRQLQAYNRGCLIGISPLFQVVEQTRAKFSRLSLQQFTSLYKAFQIWPPDVSGVSNHISCSCLLLEHNICITPLFASYAVCERVS